MYKDLTDYEKVILNGEQEKIINSKEQKILVSASPGCGKTYTLVKKIIKDSSENSKYRGFIACSFTREASRQLENKLFDYEVDTEYSFVGTIDSFVLNKIINPFKNRYINNIINNSIYVDVLKIKMPPLDSKPNKITKIGLRHPEMSVYYDKWKENFISGEYEISYCSYLLAIEMIEKMPEVANYLKSRFYGIYIDESQDLNEFQHLFIEKLIEVCNLQVLLIGDKNQSIYEFRGARPDLFSNLVMNGYTEYLITISVRCHKSIIDFSNLFLNENNNITNNISNQVYIYERENIELVKKICDENETVLWLTDDNNLAQQISELEIGSNFNFQYTKALDLKDELFNGTYFNFLEELLLFYYNYKNDNSKYIYSIEDIASVISDYVSEFEVKKVLKIIRKTNLNVVEYIKKIFKSMSIFINESIFTEIKDKLKKNVYCKHYFRDDNSRRTMTIHSSKGLESKAVIVYIDYDDYWYNRNTDEEIEQKIRNYFVAFSRAENNLHIFFRKKKVIKGIERNLNQKILKEKLNLCLKVIDDSIIEIIN